VLPKRCIQNPQESRPARLTPSATLAGNCNIEQARKNATCALSQSRPCESPADALVSQADEFVGDDRFQSQWPRDRTDSWRIHAPRDAADDDESYKEFPGERNGKSLSEWFAGRRRLPSAQNVSSLDTSQTMTFSLHTLHTPNPVRSGTVSTFLIPQRSVHSMTPHLHVLLSAISSPPAVGLIET